jgi:hypothetical protein
MLNELLREISILQMRDRETPCEKIVREFVDKNPTKKSGVVVYDSEPYFIEFFLTNSPRQANGTRTSAYRIKCDGMLDILKRTIVCETFPNADPFEANDYEWILLPLENANKS